MIHCLSFSLHFFYYLEIFPSGKPRWSSNNELEKIGAVKISFPSTVEKFHCCSQCSNNPGRKWLQRLGNFKSSSGSAKTNPKRSDFIICGESVAWWEGFGWWIQKSSVWITWQNKCGEMTSLSLGFLWRILHLLLGWEGVNDLNCQCSAGHVARVKNCSLSDL